MKIGDRIGSATLVAEIATDRWRGTLDDNTVVEIRLGHTPAFAAGWTALREATGVGTPTVYECVHHQGGTAAVHEPLDAHTASALTPPLPAAAIAAVGMRVANALGHVGDSLEGPLLPGDIGFDASGHPVLALADEPRDTSFSAPEGDGGREAALYGLGVTLYRLSTGTHPSGKRPAPPSSRSPGLPSALDDAILGLLSEKPSERAIAVRHLAELAKPIDLRAYATGGARFEQATMAPGEVKLTKTGGRQARATADIRAPAAAVVVTAETLQTLPPSGLSLLAGVTELPLEYVREATAAQKPIVVQALTRKAGAASTAIARQRELEMPLTAAVGPGFSRLIEVLFFVGAGSGLMLAALAASSMGLAFAGLVAFALCLVSIWGGVRTARDLSAVVAAHRDQEETRAAAPAWLSEVAAQRVALDAAELAEPVERDARDALNGLEDPKVGADAAARGLDAIRQLIAQDASPGDDAVTAAERTAALARSAVSETNR